MKIVLSGQVPAQKNNKQLVTNPKTGRLIPVSSKIVQEWQKDVAIQLKEWSGQPDGKVTISYQFYVKDERRRDIDNMICSVNDALVKAGLLVDDSWKHLAIGAADAQLDKANPRVELWIEEE